MLGDAVNLGARLESANKALGSRILLSQRTVDLLGDEFLCRPMGNLRVVGKSQGVLVYEVLCRRSEAADAQLQLAELSGVLVDRFQNAKFHPCIETARQMEERFGSTKFTQLYLSLSRTYLLDTPRNGFDGQIVLEEK